MAFRMQIVSAPCPLATAVSGNPWSGTNAEGIMAQETIGQEARSPAARVPAFRSRHSHEHGLPGARRGPTPPRPLRCAASAPRFPGSMPVAQLTKVMSRTPAGRRPQSDYSPVVQAFAVESGTPLALNRSARASASRRRASDAQLSLEPTGAPLDHGPSTLFGHGDGLPIDGARRPAEGGTRRRPSPAGP